jgi:hypothetical protein
MLTYLVLLAFHENQGNLSEDKKEKLLTKVSSNINEGVDALGKLKMDAIFKVLKFNDIPSPEEIYQNYEAKPEFYEEHFEPKSNSLSINHDHHTSASYANGTCWKCFAHEKLRICKQCHHSFCGICYQKPSHYCPK